MSAIQNARVAGGSPGTPNPPTGDRDLSVAVARSTDGSYGLSAPTGAGLELILATVNGIAGLQDIRFNGVSQ